MLFIRVKKNEKVMQMGNTSQSLRDAFGSMVKSNFWYLQKLILKTLLPLLVLLFIVACEKEDNGLHIITSQDDTMVIGTVNGPVPYANYIIAFKVVNSNDPDVSYTYACKYNMNKIHVTQLKSSLMHAPGTYYITTIVQKYDSSMFTREYLNGNQISIVNK